MALSLVSNIVIGQQPTTNYPDRGKVYTLNFVHRSETHSSWKNLTDTAKLIFPKNVYVKNDEGRLVSWAGKDMYVNTSQAPILMRGDRISINLGYYYKPSANSQYITTLNEEFNGFITKINPRIPLEIECEDNMWLLKQAQCPNRVFPAASWTVQTIIEWLLKNAFVAAGNTYLSSVIIPALAKVKVINGFGASETITTNVGDFRTQNETIAQVLNRLRKDYKLECFFRGDDLYCSGIVYNPADYLSNGKIFSTTYDFQNNITKDNMVYLRKDDVRLGIKAYSIDKKELTKTNSSGGLTTKHSRLEVSVGDTDGDIRTQYFWNVPDVKTLTALANQRLPKLKYEGWRGPFMSFGLPFLRHGQAVSLKDNIIPERSGGVYLVKDVKTIFDVDEGFRREIDPHIRIDGGQYTIADFENGL